MSTKLKIQKVRAEVEAHEERGWLKGYQEGLAVREEQTVNAQNANEKLKARIAELKAKRPAPTTARGALDLAWELGHPVNSGDVIPKGMTCLKDNGDCITTVDHPTDWTPMFPENIRTLDPLPDPEPDWLEAPAVIAHTDNDDTRRVWTNLRDGQWASTRHTYTRQWTALRDVTPLWSKETDE